jgi:hypothetical protein
MWWCVALLAHYDDRGHWRLAPIVTASVVAAVLGLFVTRSPVAMLAVAVLQIASLWAVLPSIDNHWAFAGFVDLALAAATLTFIVRRLVATRRVGEIDEDWYATAAPFVRLLVLAMYAFAVFHKLNTGFLEPQTSCAVYFYKRISLTPLVPLFPQTVDPVEGKAVVLGVLALEAAIPILLFGRRTWWLGIAVGIVFHVMTGAVMRHFPSIMLALYWVFVPAEVQKRWLAAVDAWIRRVARNRVGYVGVVTAHALLLSLAYVLVHELRAGGLAGLVVLRAWNVFVIAGAAIAIVAFIRTGGPVPHPPGRFRSRAYWVYGVVALFVFNCMSPYLGLKTTTSINMWSNLVVTGEESNHLVVPADALRLFDYTSDVVTVKTSNDKKLHALGRAGKKVSWLMFRHAVQKAVKKAKKEGKTIAITYVRDGETVKVRDAAKDGLLMDPGHFFERKIVKVKSAFRKNPGRCSW